jgi:hypothetical protein
LAVEELLECEWYIDLNLSRLLLAFDLSLKSPLVELML